MRLGEWVPLLGIIAGILTWRIFSLAKRRTQVAEEVLVAFMEAADVLLSARRYHMKEQGSLDTHPRADIQAFLAAVDGGSAQFARLRKARWLCEYHFGLAAARYLDGLEGTRAELVSAAQKALEDPDQLAGLRIEILDLRRHDPVFTQVADALSGLQDILLPYLRADANFWPQGWWLGPKQ